MSRLFTCERKHRHRRYLPTHCPVEVGCMNVLGVCRDKNNVDSLLGGCTAQSVRARSTEAFTLAIRVHGNVVDEISDDSFLVRGNVNAVSPPTISSLIITA